MLAFIIIIRPVNIIYLSRIKRRTWMLWTIPAISFATTLLVFAYSLLREGITPDARIAGVTVLDQTSHRAATIGGEAFYCPLTPSSGLCVLTLIRKPRRWSTIRLRLGDRRARWTGRSRSAFNTAWVSARVPVHFHVRKPETRHERIQVVNEGGKLEAINSLGALIKSLWFADTDMNVYEASNVVAGSEKGPLAAIYARRKPWRKNRRAGLIDGNTSAFAAHPGSGFGRQKDTFCPTRTSPCWMATRLLKMRSGPRPVPNARKVGTWFLESWTRRTLRGGAK